MSRPSPRKGRSSRPLQHFDDIARLFAQLSTVDPGRDAKLGSLEFDTPGKAWTFRFRCYAYISALREANEALVDSDDPDERLLAGRTPFDDWSFSVPRGSKVLTIYAKPQFKFTLTLGG